MAWLLDVVGYKENLSRARKPKIPGMPASKPTGAREQEPPPEEPDTLPARPGVQGHPPGRSGLPLQPKLKSRPRPRQVLAPSSHQRACKGHGSLDAGIARSRPSTTRRSSRTSTRFRGKFEMGCGRTGCCRAPTRRTRRARERLDQAAHCCWLPVVHQDAGIFIYMPDVLVSDAAVTFATSPKRVPTLESCLEQNEECIQHIGTLRGCDREHTKISARTFAERVIPSATQIISHHDARHKNTSASQKGHMIS